MNKETNAEAAILQLLEKVGLESLEPLPLKDKDQIKEALRKIETVKATEEYQALKKKRAAEEMTSQQFREGLLQLLRVAEKK